MHEFIIPILILVLTAYVVLPVDSIFSKIYSTEVKAALLTVSMALLMYALEKLGYVNLVFLVIPIVLLLIRLLNDIKVFKVVAIFLAILIVLFNKINFILLSDYLGIIMYTLLIGLVAKNLIYKDHD